MTDAELISELALPAYAGKTAAEKVAIINSESESAYVARLIPPATVMTILRAFADRINAMTDAETRSKMQFKWGQFAATIRSLAVGLDVHKIPPGAETNPVVDELQVGVTEGVILPQEIAILQVIGKRKATRAEALWGEGTVVSLNDVARVS